MCPAQPRQAELTVHPFYAQSVMGHFQPQKKARALRRAIKRQPNPLFLSSQCALNKGGKVKGLSVQGKGTQWQLGILSS